MRGRLIPAGVWIIEVVGGDGVRLRALAIGREGGGRQCCALLGSAAFHAAEPEPVVSRYRQASTRQYFRSRPLRTPPPAELGAVGTPGFAVYAVNVWLSLNRLIHVRQHQG